LNETLIGTRQILSDVAEKFDEVHQYQVKISEKIEKHEKIQKLVQANQQKIIEREHLVEYFKVLQDIQDISNELTHCINSKDEQKVVNLFLSLSGSLNSVNGRLQEVDAAHLKFYARRMALYWHEIIKEKLSK
jgi:hypothetical protein